MIELYYSTADLSEMMQVGKSTIKRWTEEGKLKCFRTPGGHRKFKSSDVHRFLENYQYEISPSFRFKFPPNSEIDPSTSEKFYSPSPEKNFHRAIKNNHKSIEQEWKSAFSLDKDLAKLFDNHLTPLLRQITTAFQESKITSVEFQIAKNTLIHALINGVDSIPKDQVKNSEIYCLSVNEGMNEVQLKAVELLLEHNGYTVYNLGAVLTKQSAQDIVHICKPKDVFVVISLRTASKETMGQFNELVSGVRSYGGQVYTSNFLDLELFPESLLTDTVTIHSFEEFNVQFASLTTMTVPITQ